MKEALSTIALVAAIVLTAPFIVPLALGAVAALSMNRRDAKRRRRMVVVHHGGRCTCDMCCVARLETLRKAANNERN